MLERENEARPDPSKLDDLVESSSRVDSPKRIQRKLSRDNIRESSAKFKTSLENLRSRIQKDFVPPSQIPQIGTVTTVEDSTSPPPSRGTSPVARRKERDAIKKSTSSERLKSGSNSGPNSPAKRRLVSSGGI